MAVLDSGLYRRTRFCHVSGYCSGDFKAMIIYKCDKCGAESETPYVDSRKVVMGHTTLTVRVETEGRHFCSVCWDWLESRMKNGN